MRAVLGAAAICLCLSPALGETPFGTAGPFGFVAYVGCGKPLAEEQAGACDPEPVPLGLTPSERSAEHLKRAARLLSLLRMNAVSAAADAAVEADPASVAAHLFRARFQMSFGTGRGMEEDLNAALAIEPANADALASRSWLRYQMQRYDLAMTDAHAALRARPGHVDALRIRGMIEMAEDLDDWAEQDFAAVIAATPADPRPYRARAEIRHRRGDQAGSIADLDRVLALSPRDLPAIEARAQARAAAGDVDGALDDYQSVLGRPGAPVSTRPGMPAMARMALARALLLARSQRADEAAADLGDLISRGGKPFILKLQLYLRRNGFPEMPIDGRESQGFRSALDACLRQAQCGQGISATL